MSGNIVDLNREAAKRTVKRGATEIQARIDLAAWVEIYGHLGAPFLLSALRNAVSAVETFHDLIKE